jgi:hypothetical protein
MPTVILLRHFANASTTPQGSGEPHLRGRCCGFTGFARFVLGIKGANGEGDAERRSAVRVLEPKRLGDCIQEQMKLGLASK